VAEAIRQRLAEPGPRCAECSREANWLWLSRSDVASLDDVTRIREATGRWLCAAHGSEQFFAAMAACEQANLMYMNVPYGDAGAYVWI
jgi:hypothetical protein